MRFVRRMLVLAAPPVPAARPTAPSLPGKSPLYPRASTPPDPLPAQEQRLLRLRPRRWPPHPLPLRPRWLQPEPHRLPVTAVRSDNPSASSRGQHTRDKDSTIRHRIPTMALLPNPLPQYPRQLAPPKDGSPIHKIPDGTKPLGNSRSTYVRPSHTRDKALRCSARCEDRKSTRLNS